MPTRSSDWQAHFAGFAVYFASYLAQPAADCILAWAPLMQFLALLIQPAAHRARSVLFVMLLAVLAAYFAAAHDASLDFARFVATYQIAHLPEQDCWHCVLNASHFVEYEAAKLAKRHHLLDGYDLAHCAPLVIAELPHEHRRFVALALLFCFGYLAAHDWAIVVPAPAPVALAQGLLYQHWGGGCPLANVQR